ncbi:MAG: prolyl oligopeptidase family serine peptidase [bacterium]|nr:prolyl oligopeptidase family serine peptidase [bacterium]
MRGLLATTTSLILVGLLALPGYTQTLQLQWSQDGKRCVFSTTNGEGKRQFFVLDVEKKEKRPAFDPQQLQAALSELPDFEPGPDWQTRLKSISLTDDPQELVLVLETDSFLFNQSTGIARKRNSSEADAQSSRLFLPPRPSGASDEEAEILITNDLAQPLGLYWIDPRGVERSYGTLPAGKTHEQHTYVGHVWLLKSADNQALGCFAAERGMSWRIDEQALERVQRQPFRRRPQRVVDQETPRAGHDVFVREHNLWINGPAGERRLSSDGTTSNTYRRQGSSEAADVRWSPDSRFLVAFQTQLVEERQLHLIESAPKDQLQPKLLSLAYAKPGDEIARAKVHLFDLESEKEIPLSNELMAIPWSLSFKGWSESSEEFYLLYNERGHQRLRLLAVSTSDGSVRIVVEEFSPTFIHYSDPGKLVYRTLDAGSFLWASERSGWNHLYRISFNDGQCDPITRGSWNVKRIEKVDLENALVWFYAVGVYPEQDPYHEHFCSVALDGSDFRVLTDGDGTHRVELQQDDRYLLDTYSRVDMAPVTELRDAASGELICELERQDTASQFGERRLPERFVAKGRDGKTDIWGIIHWPKDFDANQVYPVVENIYAGPHNQHVPKQFRKRYPHQQRIADAGMIVVQIDGMGTAWRSKSFHDVCFKNLRDAGFPDRIAWLKAAAEKFPQLDLSRVGIYGGSAGGQNAMAALLWHSDFYQVAVADCGCHDNRMDKIWWNEQWMGWPVDASYVENSNMEYAHLLQGKLMLIVGELDRNVDPASTIQVVRKLIEHDKDFEFVLVAGAGHGAAETPWASRKRLQFLKQHLCQTEAVIQE